MTKIRTYNKNQIGGCVVTIETEKSKIAIDFGSNLPGSEGENVEIEGLSCGKAAFDGVFFTHYHGDHVGRMGQILPEISLYMGELAKRTMQVINETLRDEEHLALLGNDTRITTLVENTPIKINGGDIVVTPYSVDHSAYEAFMFLIETPDKTILHTGDFRGHGYRGKKGLLPMIDYYIRRQGKRDVDVLITEGTMLGRMNEKVYTEAQMQADARELFRKHKYVFLICSSTNFDSLASFYHAGISQGMYLYGNRYVTRQLKAFSEYAGKYSELYQFDKVYTVDFEWKLTSSAGWQGTQEELMRKNGFVCVIKGTENYEKWVERFADLDPIVIYSMWDGYINPETKAYDAGLADFCVRHQAIPMHTSGHAAPDVLAEVIKAVNPREAILPIHTENAKGFLELDIPEELKRKVKV